jgi:phenylpropionate dioxygenase-like ring-hydroxylating dioxygenase large terminal subunit
MGDVLRRYWQPILLERELAEPDGEPVRVQLLGEDLLAFRDSSGRIGLLDEFCPHRRVSLWFGRNEEDGLRCVYHGWKFDVAGTCVDQMNEPESFAHKVKITAYPTCEVGGIIWAYLGPKEKQPPPPNFAWTQVAATHRHASKVIEECNWLQALEGGIDTSHAPILHRTLLPKNATPGVDPRTPFVRSSAPKLEVDLTDYGYRYFGVRQLPEGGEYVRGYHYVMPYTQLRPSQVQLDGSLRGYGPGHFWVPMDDHTTLVWNFQYSWEDAPLTDADRRETGNGNGPDHVDQATVRPFANRSNSYKIDRQVQKTQTYSGIPGVNTQDRALQETMGAVVDRSKEHLGPADKAIIATRRLLQDAIKTVRDGGDPPGVGTSYYRVRAIERIIPDGESWRDTIVPLMYPGDSPSPEPALAGVR